MSESQSTKKIKYIESSVSLTKEFSPKHTSLNRYTLWLYDRLYLGLQHFMRDKGIMKWIINTGFTITLIFEGLRNSRAVIEYIKLWSRTKRILFDKKNRQHFIDVIKIQESDDFPLDEEKILVFVYGGAWGSGHTYFYNLCAANAAKCLKASYAAVIEYSTYPSARIDDETETVSQAVAFIRSHPSILFPKQSPFVEQKTNELILMGHSAGANLSALMLHNHALNSVKYIDTFIPLAGVYDIVKHYEWERARGLHEVSPMGAAAHSKDKFHLFSPTLLALQCAHQNNSKYLDYFPKTLIIHGVHDTTVPITSSVEYGRSLAANGVKVNTAFPEYDHMDPIMDLSLNCYSATGEILKEYVELLTSSGV